MGQSWIPFLFTQSRSEPRQKDGCMKASCTKFACSQIRCVHHWMPGRILGLRLQCREGRRAEDVRVISAHTPVHDERIQTSMFEPLRIEFWRKMDGVIRQIPSRCRVILSMDAIEEVCTTVPLSEVRISEFVIAVSDGPRMGF